MSGGLRCRTADVRQFLMLVLFYVPFCSSEYSGHVHKPTYSIFAQLNPIYYVGLSGIVSKNTSKAQESTVYV